MEDSKTNNSILKGGEGNEQDEVFSIPDFLNQSVVNMLLDGSSRYLDERNAGFVAQAPINTNYKLQFVKKFRDVWLPQMFNSAIQRDKRILTTVNTIKPLSSYKKHQSIMVRAVEHLFKNLPAEAWDISKYLIVDDYLSRIDLIERIFSTDNRIREMLPLVLRNIYISEERSKKILFNVFEGREELRPGDLTIRLFGSNENIVISVLSVILICVSLTACLSILGLNYDDSEAPISDLLAEFIENEPELFSEIISILNERNIFSYSSDFLVYSSRLQTLDLLPIEHKKQYLIDQNRHQREKEDVLLGGFKVFSEIQDEEATERKNIVAGYEKKSKLQQETINKLKQQIDGLNKELKNSGSRVDKRDSIDSTLQMENRELKSQIIKLKNETESYRAELLNINEFTQLILNSEDAKLPETQSSWSKNVSIDEIQKNIAFIGGHENLHMKLRKSFPKALYLNPDKLNFTVDAFDNIRYCLYFTEYCNHSLFQKVSVEIKKRGIKSSFCAYNNVDKVIESLKVLVSV